MNRDDIIRMAREAGIPDANIPLIAVGRLETGEELLRAAFTLAYEAGRKEENEACAEIADQHRNNMQFLASNPPQSAAAYDIAKAIRARR